MSETTQFFFLIPLPIKGIKLDGVSTIYSLDVKNSPLVNTLKAVTKSSIDTYLLKTVTFNERYNYVNKLKLIDDAGDWMVKTLPKEYVDTYTPYCHYPLLICYERNPDTGIKYTVAIPATEKECHVHLFILFIQYIQLQDPNCELLNYLDKMTKGQKYGGSSPSPVAAVTAGKGLTRDLRNGCCFGNMFVRIEEERREGIIGVLNHRPCRTGDVDLLKRIIKRWFT